MNKAKPLVGIVVGSDSDLPVMAQCAALLDQFSIPYEITISSAHRSPNKTALYAKSVEKKGIEVLIVAAGMAAHLGGVLAAEVTIPVICVPMQTTALAGMDSLFSMVQMPSGVPVATVTIGKAGAANAAVLAAQILALKYPGIRKALVVFKKKMADEIVHKDGKLKKMGYKKYIETS